jgi:glycosyltransferase involved in cell wall biosynthesis
LSFSGKGCESGGRLSSDLVQTLENEALFQNGRLKLVTVGLLNGINLVNWFQTLDLYFMSSDSLEGFPNSLAEAVTIGLPSLANPVGAAKDLVVADRISQDCTISSMTELLEQFYREDLDAKQQTTLNSKNELLSKYQDIKILNSYKSVWETLI